MPAISFMPYFPDRGVNKRYGDFTIWNWENHKAQYVADPLTRAYLERYFAIYRKPSGEPEDRIAVISTERDGVLPEKLDEVRKAVGRPANAAMLAHVALLPVDPQGGLFASSSDNFVVLFQQFQVGSEAAALQSGSYVRTQWAAGGFDRLRFVTSQHIPDSPGSGIGDETLLGHLATLCSSDSKDAERIFRSLHWVRSAFTNADDHPYESRIVAMMTAFEILLDMPEEQKGMHFSQLLNDLLPPNKLPTSERPAGRKRKLFRDTDVGWWCRDFYDLRSRIVHGDVIQQADYLTKGSEKLKVALYLFVEGIWGLLRRMGTVGEFDGLSFWIRAEKWMDILKLPHEAFY